jgi:hypothetical protein
VGPHRRHRLRWSKAPLRIRVLTSRTQRTAGRAPFVEPARPMPGPPGRATRQRHQIARQRSDEPRWRLCERGRSSSARQVRRAVAPAVSWSRVIPRAAAVDVIQIPRLGADRLTAPRTHRSARGDLVCHPGADVAVMRSPAFRCGLHFGLRASGREAWEPELFSGRVVSADPSSPV